MAIASAAFLYGCGASDFLAVNGGTTAGAPGPLPNTGGVDRSFIWSREAGTEAIPLPANATGMYVTDVNDQGLVTGSITLRDNTDNTHAFVWSRDAGFVYLGSLIGPFGASLGSSINNFGMVTGASEGPNTPRGRPMGPIYDYTFVWSAEGGMKQVEVAEGFQVARVLSDGTIVGLDQDGSFEWKTNRRTRSVSLPSGTNCSQISNVNESGLVLSYVGSRTSSDDLCTFSLALVVNTDGTQRLITACGDDQERCGTRVSAINNSGTVTGTRAGTGFRWTAAEGFERMPIDGASGLDINDRGDVVGILGQGGTELPMVWENSGEVYQIHLPAGGKLGYGAVAINNSGLVVGNFR